MHFKGNMKGKHLTRSHAMREATSPPRTPTPRASESSSQMSPNGYQHQLPHMDVNEGNNTNNSNNKLHTQSSSTRGNSPIIDAPTVIVTSQHKQQQLHQKQSNVALCNEAEFPKLSPPKSKSGSNNSGGMGVGVGNGNCGVNTNCNNNQQRINNASEGNNNSNNINANNNNNNSSSNSNSSNNKKNNADTAGVHETHNKIANNVNINAVNTNKNFNQSQQQQLSAGNALQKALNISDNTQPTPIYNSPMNYQLHPNDVNREQQQQQQSFIVYDKENRCPRNESQNSMNSSDEMHETQQQQHQHHHHQQQQLQQHHQRSGGGKKHRTNSNSKGSKPRLKNMGSSNSAGAGVASNIITGGVVAGGISSCSIDGSLNSSNNTSGFISRGLYQTV